MRHAITPLFAVLLPIMPCLGGVGVIDHPKIKGGIGKMVDHFEKKVRPATERKYGDARRAYDRLQTLEGVRDHKGLIKVMDAYKKAAEEAIDSHIEALDFLADCLRLGKFVNLKDDEFRDLATWVRRQQAEMDKLTIPGHKAKKEEESPPERPVPVAGSGKIVI
jgi:hypothetical protein